MREVVSFYKIQTTKSNGEIRTINEEFSSKQDAERHISLYCDNKPIIIKTKIIKHNREIDGVNPAPKRRRPEAPYER
jgi:hypothetical protein